MRADVQATVGESFFLSLVTGPEEAGKTVTLTALYGIDGDNTGADGDGDALSFPVTMAEGDDGAYFTEIILSESGIFWARFEVGGVEVDISLIRVVTEGSTHHDAVADTAHTIGIVAYPAPSSVQLSTFDTSGAQAGLDSDGVVISWPQAMSQVTGYSDSWYYQDITFSDGGTYSVSIAPDNGPIRNDLITVYQPVQAGVLAHYNGWAPDAGYIPEQWVTVGYIRRWTGWTSAHVDDETIREFRRMAIETFIDVTNTWVPGWNGTWYGLRAQGQRLYLPVPLLLPQDGGEDPVINYHEPWGEQEVIESVDTDDLAWYVRGQHAKQPYVERVHGRWWDRQSLVVSITGTWGFVGVNGTIPIKLKQVIVGLIRWHSLSFGVDGEEARDQSTLYRTDREGTRDASVSYSPLAIGRGLTGDRTVDRVLAEMTVHPGPWVSKSR